jgi:hypothetical protein
VRHQRSKYASAGFPAAVTERLSGEYPTKARRNVRAGPILVFVLAALGCEPPTFSFDERPSASDYDGRRHTELSSGASIDGAGDETLVISADGFYSQSFDGPGGFRYAAEHLPWRMVEDEHRGPMLVLSDMMYFCDGVAAVQSGRVRPGELELLLRPRSSLPFGEPESWVMCHQSADLELCFSRDPSSKK